MAEKSDIEDAQRVEDQISKKAKKKASAETGSSKVDK
jgi:hypothetical protein